MGDLIKDCEVAMRLARAIVSDILLYNKEKVKEGLQNDNLFELLNDELEEGRDLFNKRVDRQILENSNYYDKAIVDVMIKRSGNIESEIW